ncbi:MAG: ral nucleoside transport system permease protein [bacterium]
MIGVLGLSLSPFDADWLAAALVLSTPILLAAIGELVSERAGVLNVGLEGMMLAGAFFSYLIAWQTDSMVLGTIAGVAAGVFFAAIMALLCVEAGADQIVSGVGINLAAVGLTGYLFDQIFGNLGQEIVPQIGSLAIPVLAEAGAVGAAIFDHDPILYLAFLVVPVVWFLLYRTRWGLAIRAAGEMPAAADTAGISVRRVRWMATLTAGAFSGLAGAYLVIVQVGIFKQQMTGGRGFLALVAVIFGRWHPVGVLAACLVLGATDALQLRLADDETVPGVVWGVVAIVAVVFVLYQLLVNRGRPRPVAIALVTLVGVSGLALFVTTPSITLPDQVWRSLPFLLALIVLAGALTRSHMPAKLTLPYRRGEG